MTFLQKPTFGGVKLSLFGHFSEKVKRFRDPESSAVAIMWKCFRGWLVRTPLFQSNWPLLPVFAELWSTIWQKKAFMRHLCVDSGPKVIILVWREKITGFVDKSHVASQKYDGSKEKTCGEQGSRREQRYGLIEILQHLTARIYGTDPYDIFPSRCSLNWEQRSRGGMNAVAYPRGQPHGQTIRYHPVYIYWEKDLDMTSLKDKSPSGRHGSVTNLIEETKVKI